MSRYRYFVFAGLTLATLPLVVAVCADSSGRDPNRPPLEIEVGALNLANIENVCFAFEVRNDADALVVEQSHICSHQYGNAEGGDISYVATCDATDTNNDGAFNTVTLAIENIYTTTSPWTGNPLTKGDTEWQNPCLDNSATERLEGCTLSIECIENQDALVEFNLTVMREAQQGFFDIAVNFEDIFCSAKVDCVDEMLHYPAPIAGKDRGPTAVIAFACTSGAGPNGPANTTMYLDKMTIACSDANYAVSPIGAGGNLGGQSPGVFQSAVYYGKEELPGYDKCYWNTAIGLGANLGSDCVLTSYGSAAETLFSDTGAQFHSPAFTAYPKIHFNVTLTDGTGALVCDDNGPFPLNGDNGGVTTEYTDLSKPTGEAYDYAMRCGTEPTLPTSTVIISNVGTQTTTKVLTQTEFVTQTVTAK